MLVKVEQHHIVNGKRKKCEFCPIALAMKEVLPATATDIWVGGFTVAFINGEDKKIYNLPRQAQEFIHWFDCGHSVEPFEFELEI